MQKQVIEHINSEITKYIDMVNNQYSGIVLVSRILMVILPHIKGK